MDRLREKIAVITGGNSGIGLATARRFVDEGAYVFISARRQAELDKAQSLIGRNVSAVPADVSVLADVDRLFGVVKAEKAVVDVLVANAGVIQHETIDTATAENFDWTFGVNARGVYFTVSRALPLMKPGGSIILVSSVASVMGNPAHGTYAASKAAVRSFARTWTAELSQRGIRVNVLSPGPVETPIIDAQFGSQEQADAARASMSARVPLGRMGRAEEIASVALFLASEDSSFVTGVDLAADGGLTQI